MEQKRKEEIRKSIIACDNDIVKLRSQAENLEEIIKNQKCTQKRFESECDKYEIKRQKKKIKLENMSCLIQNVKLVERYVGRMSDRVSGNCYNVNSNRLLNIKKKKNQKKKPFMNLNMMKQMDKEILNNENMLEEKYDMISSIMYKRQILKYELRRLG